MFLTTKIHGTVTTQSMEIFKIQQKISKHDEILTKLITFSKKFHAEFFGFGPRNRLS